MSIDAYVALSIHHERAARLRAEADRDRLISKLRRRSPRHAHGRAPTGQAERIAVRSPALP